ncbi:MAG: peptidylprolyl isomerase [Sphingopyxis sp.]
MTLTRAFVAFSIWSLALSAPVTAQEAAPPVAAPTAAPAAPAAPTPAIVPAIVPAEYLNNPEHMLALDLSTGGRVVIQLRPDAAPHHVERIKLLARQGFYDGLIFHRVIEGFMAQGGDPRGTGEGGSSLPDLGAEFNSLPHVRGVLSMARSDSPDSANSQFFLMLMPRLALDNHYTAFGRIVSGMEFVDRIQRGEPPASPSRIVQMSVMADNRPMPPASSLIERAPAAPSAPVTVDELNAPLNR